MSAKAGALGRVLAACCVPMVAAVTAPSVLKAVNVLFGLATSRKENYRKQKDNRTNNSFHFRLLPCLNVFVNSKRIYKQRDYKSESQSKQSAQNSENNADNPEDKLNSEKPYYSVKV